MLNNNDISNLKVGFIGLGYAGFPMACLFSRKYKVVGFDLSESRIAELKQKFDHCGDVNSHDIGEMMQRGSEFTSSLEDLRQCNFYVIVVPTPVDKNFRPDVSYIKAASREVGSILSKGDIVVFESTVYPGATEEICVPAIEAASGLKYNVDFFAGYSPERINPGDRLHTPDNVVKVTSGSTPEVAAFIDRVYASILGEGMTWQAPSIRVAEAAKIVENTQRDVNIAFMNEVAQIMNAFGIDFNEVLEAMNTKWNALGFRPGLVGGHCIGVDPYYLIEFASRKGIAAGLMSMARGINNSMPGYVTEQIIQSLASHTDADPAGAKILLLGFTFKENCPDIRNTRVIDIYRLLARYTTHVEIYDPLADASQAENLYGVKVCTRCEELKEHAYDVMALCVAHDEFRDFDFSRYGAGRAVVYDVKGCLPQQTCGDGRIDVVKM
ncbi:MAG: nucleotide sugar dehydrogenase [Alistipes sp.]|nr:nucleotide sugar dehydrogenase [Alistipes sp.]